MTSPSISSSSGGLSLAIVGFFFLLCWTWNWMLIIKKMKLGEEWSSLAVGVG